MSVQPVSDLISAPTVSAFSRTGAGLGWASATTLSASLLTQLYTHVTGSALISSTVTAALIVGGPLLSTALSAFGLGLRVVGWARVRQSAATAKKAARHLRRAPGITQTALRVGGWLRRLLTGLLLPGVLV